MTTVQHVPRYVSTRGQGAPVSFREALLGGLAPDGGLYIPDRIPVLDPACWQQPASLVTLAQHLFGTWLKEDVSPGTLDRLLIDALNFPVALISLQGPGWEGVSVLELFHGPTLSFKDFGARVMARLMAHYLQDDPEPLTILVATSGDTGSAVADGFAGQEGIRVILLYPSGQVSPVQERQLIVARPGVQALAVDGTFDDCQRLVKAAFQTERLAHKKLSSANSINIGRLLPQMLYYIWGVAQQGGGEVMFCVPSGNLGNLTGGMLGALGGLPVARFLAAHNANDFFPRYLSGASVTYGDSVRTLSNAMDVGVPSNFERLTALLPDDALRRKIQGVRVSDEETLQSMRRVFETTGYLADPHTAVGLEGVRRYRASHDVSVPLVVLSTAHPAKFPETVEQALGFVPPSPERLARLWEQETNVLPLPVDLDALCAHVG